MTENNNFGGVSPDKLPRPLQDALHYQAAVRAIVLGNAVSFAAQSLSPMLTNVLVAEATKYPVENYQQPAPQPVYEQPAQPVQYQAPAPAAPSAQSYLDMPAYQPAMPTSPQQSQYNGDGVSMDLYAQPSAAETNAYLNELAQTEPTPEFAPAPTSSATDEQAQRLEAARQNLAGLHDELDAQNSYGLAA